MEFPDRLVIHRDIDGTLTHSVTGASFPVREHDVITLSPDGSDANTGEALRPLSAHDGNNRLHSRDGRDGSCTAHLRARSDGLDGRLRGRRSRRPMWPD
jgi:hypothetical protein